MCLLLLMDVFIAASARVWVLCSTCKLSLHIRVFLSGRWNKVLQAIEAYEGNESAVLELEDFVQKLSCFFSIGIYL